MSNAGPSTAAELATVYQALSADCRALAAAIAGNRALDDCLQQTETIGAAMAALPDPAGLREADDPARMAELRTLLDELVAAHRAGVEALRERMHRERGSAAADQRRGSALRAYGGNADPTPRFHDRRG